MNSKLSLALALALFTFAASASANEPAWTSIAVQEMHCGGCAKKIAARLYAVRGVKEVRIDLNAKTLFVAPQESAVLSPLAMWEAVEKAKDIPVRLTGPSGTFTAKPNF